MKEVEPGPDRCTPRGSRTPRTPLGRLVPRPPAEAVGAGREAVGQVSRAGLVDMQRRVGNAAVAGILAAHPRPSLTLQRKDDAPNGHDDGDDGGRAEVTDLEQDMRDVLVQWSQGARDGVGLFVTTQLSARLDDLESGSWTTFLSGLLGNTIWAAAAFAPVGGAVLAFRISMAGVGVGSVPNVPSPSKSALPAVTRLGEDYINTAFDQLNEQLRGKAAALVRAHPGISRYRALAEFVRSSFAAGTYDSVSKTGSIPRLDKGAVRDRFERSAADRLEVFTKVGSHPTHSEYTVNEVAWIRMSPGDLRLALVLTDFFVGDPHYPHDFVRWIPQASAAMATDRWLSHPYSQGRLRTLDKADITGL